MTFPSLEPRPQAFAIEPGSADVRFGASVEIPRAPSPPPWRLSSGPLRPSMSSWLPTATRTDVGWMVLALASLLVYPLAHCVIQRRRRLLAAKAPEDLA